jgi:hypothetical protein
MLTLFHQASVQSEPAASDVTLQSTADLIVESPVPFEASNSNDGKRRLRKSKTVSFAPLPSSWRLGMCSPTPYRVHHLAYPSQYQALCHPR